MDACYRDEHRPIGGHTPTEDIASELDAWFAVSGDMDDFIYFGDVSKKHSEK